MRIVNFVEAMTVRIGFEGGDDVVDPIAALGGGRRLDAKSRAILSETVSLIAAGPEGGAWPNAE